MELSRDLAVALYRLARPAGARVGLTADGGIYFDVRVVWKGDPTKIVAAALVVDNALAAADYILDEPR